MNLLYVGNFLPGSNRPYAADLADRLEARGWSVTRTSSRVPRAQRLLDMLWTTWSARREAEVAIVDLFSGPAFAWAEATCFELAALRKPFVLSLHGGNLPAFAERWPRRVRRLLQSAAAVTAPSRYNWTHMRRYRDDITVLHNAVDTLHRSYVPRTTVAPRLIWVRAFHAIYNPVMAVEVLARTHPAARLTMLGPDKGDGSLAATNSRARELGVADRLEITGRVPPDEVSRRLAEADIFINTTTTDNTPLSVLEALATGLCVVSTNVGGIPFLVEHEREALLVPPGDAPAMAAAVHRLFAEEGLAGRLSAAGRALATQYDWSSVLPQWESLLAQVTHV